MRAPVPVKGDRGFFFSPKENPMACQKCKSERVASINGKCSDMCFFKVPGYETRNGYSPQGVGLKNSYGDYVEFDYCLECGQIQGKFPVSEESVKAVFAD